MGLPEINVVFNEVGVTAIQRGERGVVALILKEPVLTGSFELFDITDMPEGLATDNEAQIQLAFMGGEFAPKKVVGYYAKQVGGVYNYTEALDFLESIKFDYLAIPEIEADRVTEIATWIKSCRDTKDKRVKAVLPNCPSDHEGIINFATEYVKVGDLSYTTAEYCSRLAGIFAGNPLTMSATYQVLPEVTDVPHLTKAQFDTAIDSGKLVLRNDGAKVKIARAVNSLVTLSTGKGASHKKIKVIDILDLIQDDIKATAEDSYVGKFSNSYDNKCVLISAIQGYFEALEIEGLLFRGKSSTYINTKAQLLYLKSTGIATTGMNDQQIKEADTDDKVFVGANIKVLDAIEDISFAISI